jgi:hypothetical protein
MSWAGIHTISCRPASRLPAARTGQALLFMQHYLPLHALHRQDASACVAILNLARGCQQPTLECSIGKLVSQDQKDLHVA